MREKFHSIKLMWLGYLVYSLGNCVMKLCIETDLTHVIPFGLLIDYLDCFFT